MNIAISVIIPVFHERSNIHELLTYLLNISASHCIEIIVIDGDNEKSTIKTITSKKIMTLTSKKGRAYQMNKGAEKAKGKILLFLHADTFIPPDAFSLITKVCSDEKIVGGAFRLGFDACSWKFNLIRIMANFRTLVFRLPFGDQAFFIKRSYFQHCGGFSNIPLMEDMELMLRIKKEKHVVHIIKEHVITSARKWQQQGVLCTTLLNWKIQLLFLCGISPDVLVHYYYRAIKKK